MSNQTKQTLTLQFDDPEDLQRFLSFMKRAKESEGTPSPIWCELGASAVKRSKIVGESYLLEACRSALEMLRSPKFLGWRQVHCTDDELWAMTGAMDQREDELSSAIARAEGKA